MTGREEPQHERRRAEDGAVDVARLLEAECRVFAAEAQEIDVQAVHGRVRLALVQIEPGRLERADGGGIGQLSLALEVDDARKLREEFAASWNSIGVLGMSRSSAVTAR